MAAALEAAIGLVGRPLGQLGLLVVGLALGGRAGLDGGVELGLAVGRSNLSER